MIFSCTTGKPLALKHDQISCVHCTRALTRILNSGKRANKITESDLCHPGKPCYCNTKHGPAVAEEYAMEDLGKFLVVDHTTGKLRPDDEVILGLHIIAPFIAHVSGCIYTNFSRRVPSLTIFEGPFPFPSGALFGQQEVPPPFSLASTW